MFEGESSRSTPAEHADMIANDRDEKRAKKSKQKPIKKKTEQERPRNMEKMYEEHLIEEHATKMKILKKEQLPYYMKFWRHFN